MTIAKRLYVNFGAILGICAFLLLVFIFAIMREHSTRNATSASMDIAQQDELIRFRMMQNRLNLSNYLLSGMPSDAAQVDAGYQKLQNLLNSAVASASNDSIRTPLIGLQSAEQDWNQNFAQPLMQKRQQVNSGNATVSDLQVYYLNLDPPKWVNNSMKLIDEAESANTKTLEQHRRSDESAATFTTIVIIVGGLLVLVLGITIAYKTSRSIVDPLGQLIGVAGEIGTSGDLNHTIDINRDDEIGDLARSFQSMVDYLKEMAAVSEAIAAGDLTVEVEPRSKRDTFSLAFSRMTQGLRNLVRAVRDAASQVAAGSNQIAEASEESARIGVQSSSAIDEVTSTMHEMSINVQNMVKNTQVQASSVSETSSSIDQMVASIQRVADTAKVLLDISNRSREEVQNGSGTMQKATEGLNRINRSIGSSAEIIAELGKRVDEIGKIIEVIDDISEQTNLLALNAAIEAARAGEHGLGFAVVADEVRKLAEKSAQSTKEISELIQSIQKEARKAVDNMEKSTGIVDEGLELGNELNVALRKISNVVTEVYKFAQEIGSATNEQSHGSSQIARATTRLNEITHEINSSVEEQAGGAQAVVRAMERMREMVQQSSSSSTELAASSEQMSKMSRSLLEVVDRFAIDDHADRRAGEETRKLGGSKYALAELS